MSPHPVHMVFEESRSRKEALRELEKLKTELYETKKAYKDAQDNLRLKAQEHDFKTRTHEQEVSEVRKEVLNISVELEKLRNENAQLQAEVHQVSHNASTEVTQYVSMLEKREVELETLHRSLEQQREEYQKLMHMKLDLELALQHHGLDYTTIQYDVHDDWSPSHRKSSTPKGTPIRRRPLHDMDHSNKKRKTEYPSSADGSFLTDEAAYVSAEGGGSAGFATGEGRATQPLTSRHAAKTEVLSRGFETQGFGNQGLGTQGFGNKDFRTQGFGTRGFEFQASPVGVGASVSGVGQVTETHAGSATAADTSQNLRTQASPAGMSVGVSGVGHATETHVGTATDTSQDLRTQASPAGVSVGVSGVGHATETHEGSAAPAFSQGFVTHASPAGMGVSVGARGVGHATESHAGFVTGAASSQAAGVGHAAQTHAVRPATGPASLIQPPATHADIATNASLSSTIETRAGFHVAGSLDVHQADSTSLSPSGQPVGSPVSPLSAFPPAAAVSAPAHVGPKRVLLPTGEYVVMDSSYGGASTTLGGTSTPSVTSTTAVTTVISSYVATSTTLVTSTPAVTSTHAVTCTYAVTSTTLVTSTPAVTSTHAVSSLAAGEVGTTSTFNASSSLAPTTDIGKVSAPELSGPQRVLLPSGEYVVVDSTTSKSTTLTGSMSTTVVTGSTSAVPSPVTGDVGKVSVPGLVGPKRVLLPAGDAETVVVSGLVGQQRVLPPSGKYLVVDSTGKDSTVVTSTTVGTGTTGGVTPVAGGTVSIGEGTPVAGGIITIGEGTPVGSGASTIGEVAHDPGTATTTAVTPIVTGSGTIGGVTLADVGGTGTTIDSVTLVEKVGSVPAPGLSGPERIITPSGEYIMSSLGGNGDVTGGASTTAVTARGMDDTTSAVPDTNMRTAIATDATYRSPDVLPSPHFELPYTPFHKSSPDFALSDSASNTVQSQIPQGGIVIHGSATHGSHAATSSIGEPGGYIYGATSVTNVLTTSGDYVVAAEGSGGKAGETISGKARPLGGATVGGGDLDAVVGTRIAATATATVDGARVQQGFSGGKQGTYGKIGTGDSLVEARQFSDVLPAAVPESAVECMSTLSNAPGGSSTSHDTSNSHKVTEKNREVPAADDATALCGGQSGVAAGVTDMELVGESFSSTVANAGSYVDIEGNIIRPAVVSTIDEEAVSGKPSVSLEGAYYQGISLERTIQAATACVHLAAVAKAGARSFIVRSDDENTDPGDEMPPTEVNDDIAEPIPTAPFLTSGGTVTFPEVSTDETSRPHIVATSTDVITTTVVQATSQPVGSDVYSLDASGLTEDADECKELTDDRFPDSSIKSTHSHELSPPNTAIISPESGGQQSGCIITETYTIDENKSQQQTRHGQANGTGGGDGQLAMVETRAVDAPGLSGPRRVLTASGEYVVASATATVRGGGETGGTALERTDFYEGSDSNRHTTTRAADRPGLSGPKRILTASGEYVVVTSSSEDQTTTTVTTENRPGPSGPKRALTATGQYAVMTSEEQTTTTTVQAEDRPGLSGPKRILTASGEYVIATSSEDQTAATTVKAEDRPGASGPKRVLNASGEYVVVTESSEEQTTTTTAQAEDRPGLSGPKRVLTASGEYVTVTSEDQTTTRVKTEDRPGLSGPKRVLTASGEYVVVTESSEEQTSTTCTTAQAGDRPGLSGPKRVLTASGEYVMMTSEEQTTTTVQAEDHPGLSGPKRVLTPSGEYVVVTESSEEQKATTKVDATDRPGLSDPKRVLTASGEYVVVTSSSEHQTTTTTKDGVITEVKRGAGGQDGETGSYLRMDQVDTTKSTSGGYVVASSSTEQRVSEGGGRTQKYSVNVTETTTTKRRTKGDAGHAEGPSYSLHQETQTKKMKVDGSSRDDLDNTNYKRVGVPGQAQLDVTNWSAVFNEKTGDLATNGRATHDVAPSDVATIVIATSNFQLIEDSKSVAGSGEDSAVSVTIKTDIDAQLQGESIRQDNIVTTHNKEPPATGGYEERDTSGLEIVEDRTTAEVLSSSCNTQMDVHMWGKFPTTQAQRNTNAEIVSSTPSTKSNKTGTSNTITGISESSVIVSTFGTGSSGPGFSGSGFSTSGYSPSSSGSDTSLQTLPKANNTFLNSQMQMAVHHWGRRAIKKSSPSVQDMPEASPTKSGWWRFFGLQSTGTTARLPSQPVQQGMTSHRASWFQQMEPSFWGKSVSRRENTRMSSTNTAERTVQASWWSRLLRVCGIAASADSINAQQSQAGDIMINNEDQDELDASSEQSWWWWRFFRRQSTTSTTRHSSQYAQRDVTSHGASGMWQLSPYSWGKSVRRETTLTRGVDETDTTVVSTTAVTTTGSTVTSTSGSKTASERGVHLVDGNRKTSRSCCAWIGRLCVWLLPLLFLLLLLLFLLSSLIPGGMLGLFLGWERGSCHLQNSFRQSWRFMLRHRSPPPI